MLGKVMQDTMVKLPYPYIVDCRVELISPFSAFEQAMDESKGPHVLKS